jgi:hypothetical protein
VAADLTADVFVAAIESAETTVRIGERRSRGCSGSLSGSWLPGCDAMVASGRLAARVRGRELLDVDDAERISDRLAAEEQHRRLYTVMAATAPCARADHTAQRV